MAIRIVPASGLEKIFLDGGPSGTYSGGSLLCNEGYSFQFAFTGIPGLSPAWAEAEARIESELAENLDLYLVEQVPVTLHHTVDRWAGSPESGPLSCGAGSGDPAHLSTV